MHSEFYNVALDRIRYSLVWEDSTTLQAGLNVGKHDTVLVITSAGCNVLNTLLHNPRRVIAIDLNPLQNRLLELKGHCILHHEYDVLRGLLGLDGPVTVRKAWSQLEKSLPTGLRKYWAPFFKSHPEGMLTAGRLESYVTGFLKKLDADTQQKLQHLLTFETVEAQWNFFRCELQDGPFYEAFIDYFSDENLSKGRDSRLFRYAQEPGGEAFYNRLVRQISTVLVGRNFFFRFLFFGPLGLPETSLPPCYQRRHFQLLRKQLSKLTIVDGEAVDYLLSAKGACVTKASLSNIFEYTSPAEFEQVCRMLLADHRPLRFMYWNLLQEQGSESAGLVPAVSAVELPANSAACFYFRNVRVMENLPVHPPISKPAMLL